MTDDERLAMVRAAMPAVTAVAYLNTGTYGPLSRPAHEAMLARERRDLEIGRGGWPAQGEHAHIEMEARRLFARLLGATEDEVALTRGTSDAINYALWGLDWRPGNEIVLTNVEHIGGLGAAYVIRDRFDVKLRFADCAAGGGQAVEAVRAELSSRTRAVVYSHVAWGDGAVLPVAEIAEVARAAGALAVVDGAQAAGAVPVEVRALGVDAYAVPGQKWLCGPGGTGALYVAVRAQERLRPSFASYGTFASYDEAGRAAPHPNARRYELGYGHTPSLRGLVAGLRWLLDDVGLAWAQARTVAIAGHARERLAAIAGVQVRTPVGTASGLTNFALDGWDADAAVDALFARGVVVRAVPRPHGLRASTGFFNDEADIERLTAALAELHGAARR